MHYKDQFKLPPSPLNVDFDMTIRMMKHCFNSQSKASMINSAFNLIKMYGANVIIIDGNIAIQGFLKIKNEDYYKIREIINNNGALAVKILMGPNVFNY